MRGNVRTPPLAFSCHAVTLTRLAICSDHSHSLSSVQAQAARQRSGSHHIREVIRPIAMKKPAPPINIHRTSQYAVGWSSSEAPVLRKRRQTREASKMQARAAHVTHVRHPAPKVCIEDAQAVRSKYKVITSRKGWHSQEMLAIRDMASCTIKTPLLGL